MTASSKDPTGRDRPDPDVAELEQAFIEVEFARSRIASRKRRDECDRARGHRAWQVFWLTFLLMCVLLVTLLVLLLTH